MKPTKILIRALRETAHLLRTGQVYYSWWDPDQCNCGLLAQQVLGIDSDILLQMRRCEEHGPLYGWGLNTPTTFEGMMICRQSGLPVNELVTRLEAAGIEPRDMEELEMVRGQDNVATWMDTKADELERRRLSLSGLVESPASDGLAASRPRATEHNPL